MKFFLKVVSLVLAAAMLLGIGVLAANEKPVYVALGDSIAEGTGLRNADVASYGALIAATNGYEFINHAVAGHRTEDLLSRLSEENVAADVAKADIISISIGGNDFLLADMYKMIFAAWTREDYTYMDTIIDGIYKNVCAIIERIKTLNPDALLMIQTLYNPETGLKQEVYAIGLEKLNGCYARYLREHPGSIVIVDAGSAVKADEGMMALDNIHPNADGHVAIARAYLKVLAGLGYGEATEPVIAEKGKNMFMLIILRIMMPAGYLLTAVFGAITTLVTTLWNSIF